MINGRKYSCCILSMTLLILSLIASFNYWQDPANLFLSERQYKEFSEALTEGHILAVRGNYDERMFKKSEIVAKRRIGCDIIVLGSSRVMGFSKENLGDNLNVENLGVSGAVLQDDVSMWYIHQKVNEDSTVKTVVIEAAPWIFNTNNEEHRWKVLTDDYIDGMKFIGKPVDVHRDYEKYFQLVSKKYTQLSYEQWREKKKICPFLICDDSDEIMDEWYVICQDGSWRWPKKLYQMNSQAMAENFVKGKVYHVEGYEELDKDLQNNFSLFIKHLQEQKIKVVLYFPPYHPYVYNFLKDNPRYSKVFEAELWFKNFALTHNIEVIGSYNPADMGLNEYDFLDGGHVKRESFIKFARFL